MKEMDNTVKGFLEAINPFGREDENIPTFLFLIRKILAFIVIYFGCMLIAEPIVIIIHYAMGYDVLHGEMLSLTAMTLMKYYGYIVHIGLILLYCKIFESRSPKTLGFNKRIVGYLKGMLVAVVLLSSCLGLGLLTGSVKYNGIFEVIDYKLIFAFMLGFIIQSAMEEAMCRGFLMTSLSKKLPITLAIFVSSLAFAWPHFSSLFKADLAYCIIGVTNLLLMSAIFSLFMINDRNIYVACGLHFFWNFILLNICGLNLSGKDGGTDAVFNLSTNGNSILNGGQYGIEASILTTFVLLVCALLLVYQFMKLNIKKIEF